MRSVAIAASLVLLLSAAPVFAQAAAQPRRAQPAAPAPAQVMPPPTSAPLPQGAKVGLVNLQQIAALSADGKAATGRVQALIQKKQVEGQQKSKMLQDNQQKLEQGGALMNDAARAALQKEIDRQQLEGQRFEQDAQAEVTELQTELQNEFQKKLFPILAEMAHERNLHVLLSAADTGAIWWEPGIDLTAEAIKRLDAGGAPKPAAAPAAPKQ
jgi:Skp family chaperone for outer membrane proteins